MAYFIAIVAPLLLLVLFLVLTAFERRKGFRVLAGPRSSLDALAQNMAASARTAEPLAVILRGVRTLVGHVVHDVATVALAVVRAVERALAGKVRRLRSERTPERTETRSGFLKSISYFKRTLRTPAVVSSEETVAKTVE